MNNNFYTNPKVIDSKIKTLKEIGKSNDGWTVNYIDDLNKNWELNYYETEYRNAGIQVLKKVEEIFIENLILIALESQNTEDIIGASIELYFQEKVYKKDFRQKLSEKLNQINLKNISEFEKERLKIIIYETSLYDATNRREILGKKKEEIENDAKYYRQNSEIAKKILEKIK